MALPKFDVANLFNEQKNNLLKNIEEKIKLPVQDLTINIYNKNSKTGDLKVTFDKNIKALLSFKVENKEIVTSDQINLNDLWGKIYHENKKDILPKIFNNLDNNKSQTEDITVGSSNILYIYSKGNPTPICIRCEWVDSAWTISNC